MPASRNTVVIVFRFNRNDSLGTIVLLKRYERFKDKRREKAEAVAKLKKLVEQIYSLNNRLKNALPKTKLRALRVNEEDETVEVQPEKKVVARPREEPVKKKPATALDKLEMELTALESKLESLK